MIKILITCLMMSSIPPEQTLVLCDFSQKDELKNWNVVDDIVMGGRSQGNILKTDNGFGLFSGRVSTANNGGFSSVRKSLSIADVSSYNTIFIIIKGDGKSYQVRLKANQSDSFSYVQNIKTSGEWQTIELALQDFYPVFRGRELNLPQFQKKSISEFALLIGNKVNQNFILEIAKVYLK